jgi:myo-inositol-1(or 4)-monophosphatase
LLQSKDLTWIIDPLDGTTNFIHGVPVYSISIALMEGPELILGVIYEINLKECFYTWKGSPSYLNGLEINVSVTDKVRDSLFATGFPYYDYGRLDPYLHFFRYLMENSHGLRRLGSAAADLAYVACGRFDGFYEYGLSPWDVAAGALIVKNAGGAVSDFNGKDDFIFGKEIIATNGSVFDDFFEAFTKNFI